MVQTKTVIKTSAAAARRPAVSQPVVLGCWQLLSLIGEGRTAHVYAARTADGAADAAYAVKVLRWPFDTNPRGLEMLRREAHLGRRISNPHVIPVLAGSIAEAPYYVVMPRLAGQTVAEMLRPGAALDVPVALWIARQAAEGLAAIHDAGWVHGDVKSANIMVDSAGHSTLIDLGFAQAVGALDSAEDSELRGTLGYLAPEQLVANCRADQRSDLFSLGVLLFELLAGRLPYSGSSPEELVELQRSGLPCDLRKFAPHVPGLALRLVRELLSKEPMRRPQTAREVADRLASLEIATFAERQCA